MAATHVPEKRDAYPRLCTVPEVCEPLYFYDDTDQRFDSARVYLCDLIADGAIPTTRVELSTNGRVRKYWLTSSAAILAFIALQLRGHMRLDLIAEVLRKFNQRYDVTETTISTTRDIGDQFLDIMAVDSVPNLSVELRAMQNPVLSVHISGDDEAVHPHVLDGVGDLLTEHYDPLDVRIITSLRCAKLFACKVEQRFDPKTDLELAFDFYRELEN